MNEHLLIFWQRKLEDAYRENYELKTENARLKAEVERLTKAGDDMADTLEREGFYGAINCWNKAKEGKQS